MAGLFPSLHLEWTNFTANEGHSRKFSRDLTSEDESYLNKEPRCEERQGSVLAIEAVMIRVEGKVIQIEEPAK